MIGDGQAGDGAGSLKCSHIKLYSLTACVAAGGQAAAIDGKGELRGAGGSYAGVHIDAGGISAIGAACDSDILDVQGGVACSAFDKYSVIRTRYFQAAIAFTRNSQGGVCTIAVRAHLCIHINPIVACDGILANQFDSQGKRLPAIALSIDPGAIRN